MQKRQRYGLTLVEVVIAIVAVSILMMATVWVLRARQARQWQAMAQATQAQADRDPDEVFHLNCWPDGDTFSPDDDIEVICEVTNPTAFTLIYAPEGFMILPHDNPNLEPPIVLAVDLAESTTRELTRRKQSARYPGVEAYELERDETIRFHLSTTESISERTQKLLESVDHSVWLDGLQESARSEPFRVEFDDQE